ncbi:hypothetical protein AURDEDRAFT_180912 [Auricularia subglabra TFB-10046 SS5]|nr:hypothetical protein AURDEDRAFT_180912 [Auricularia subglabra TFB-10046 SS5]
MSRLEIFPKSKPLDDPPQPQHTLRHGYRTPCYGLAWAVPSVEYEKGLPAGVARNLSSTVRIEWLNKWLKEHNFSISQHPVTFYGGDGKRYLIAMFNHQEFPNFAERSQNPDDLLLVAARDVLRIRPEWEGSLKWYRFPMRWPLYDFDDDASR